jgi:hypothetical protein
VTDTPQASQPSLVKRRPPNAGKGRVKGSMNRVTADVRGALAQAVEGNVGRLKDCLERVAQRDPAKFVELVARLSEFVVPKLQRSELTGRDGQPIETKAVLDQAALETLRELGDRVRTVGMVHVPVPHSSEPKQPPLQH